MRLDLLGANAYHLVEVDQAEIDRRNAFDLGPLTSRAVLRVLSYLPHLEPIPLADLPDHSQQLLRQLPDGIVELKSGRVTRVVKPALSLSCAVVVDSESDRGLDNASKFAPFCPRLLTFIGPHRDLATVEVEAAFYGIGLARPQDGRLQLLVAPAPTVAKFGPASWRVREDALAAFGRAATSAA